MEVDPATLLHKYRLRTLNPTRWEDIDHQEEGGAVEDVNDGTRRPGTDTREEPDPLGIRESISYVLFTSFGRRQGERR